MASYKRQKRSCGKVQCGKCAGVRRAHGPYWYAFWRDAKGRVRSRYMGKVRAPEWGKEELGAPPPVRARRRRRKA